MKKYRILEVAPFPPGLGGISVSVQRLFDNLQHESDFVVNKYRLNSSLPSVFGRKLGIFLKFGWLFVYILFAKRYDLIHFHVSGVSRRMLISRIIPIIAPSSKIVFTMHGDIKDVLEEDPKLKEFSSADSIIAVKEGDSKLFPKQYKGKVFDIPAFIFPNTSKPLQLPDILQNFLTKEKPILLMCGSIVVSKQYNDLYGFADCIDLYYDLKKQGVYVKLLMACTGYKYEQEKLYHDDLCKKIANEKDIMLYDSAMEFWPILDKCDIFIRPTKTDGDALSIREALYMKKIVVTSNVVKRPEDVVLYSDKADLLQKVLSCLDDIEEYKNRISEQHDFYHDILDVYYKTLK